MAMDSRFIGSREGKYFCSLLACSCRSDAVRLAKVRGVRKTTIDDEKIGDMHS
jgi:hypothetical protein